MQYKTVPIESIRADASQPRKNFDENTIKRMSISIKNEGIINSIEVDSDLIIITGEQRWRAAKMAGLTEVPIKIIEGISTKERFIRQVQENIHQNTMAPLDTALALEQIRKDLANSAADVARDKFHKGEHFKKGIKELHELLGIDETTIIDYLNLLGYKGKMKEALKDPKFSRTKIVEIKNTVPKYQKDLENIIATQKDITRDTVRHISRALNRADKYGEHDKAKKLLKENFNELDTLSALYKINKIVPEEEERVKEPADALKFLSERMVEMMDFLDNHPLESFDDFHRSLVTKDINLLGFYLQSYLKGKNLEVGKETAKLLNGVK